MRAVIQRVSRAKVSVENETVGEIGGGILILIGIERDDAETDAFYILEKTLNLRIFEDAGGKMNLSLLDTKGALLVVSQFTICGDARRGRRPSYEQAAAPAEANRLYEFFVNETRKKQISKVETGRFQTMMQVESVNDGPVTILLDRRKLF